VWVCKRVIGESIHGLLCIEILVKKNAIRPTLNMRVYANCGAGFIMEMKAIAANKCS